MPQFFAYQQSAHNECGFILSYNCKVKVKRISVDKDIRFTQSIASRRWLKKDISFISQSEAGIILSIFFAVHYVYFLRGKILHSSGPKVTAPVAGSQNSSLSGVRTFTLDWKIPYRTGSSPISSGNHQPC